MLRAHLAGQRSSKEARKAGAERVTGRRRRDLKDDVAQRAGPADLLSRGSPRGFEQKSDVIRL